MSERLVDPAALAAWASHVLQDLGMRAEDADIGADVMVTNDVRGTHTHGIRFLPHYVPLFREGGMNPAAEPRIVREGPATAVMDGDAGMGHVVAYRATESAIARTRDGDAGVTVMLVRNSNHFGGAGYFSLMAAEAGQIAIVLTNSCPVMAAPGSRGAVISNSPFSYGAPAADGHGDVMLDIALSEVAGSRVLMAAERGEEIPEGWIVDADGLPTTDPSQLLGTGALLPMGGHKGYGIALLVEILSGVLSGAGITQQVGYYLLDPAKPTDTGHAIITLDIERFMPRAEFDERLAHLRTELHEAPKAVGSDAILMPGEPEFAHERATRADGLGLDDVTFGTLEEVAAEFGRSDELGGALL